MERCGCGSPGDTGPDAGADVSLDAVAPTDADSHDTQSPDVADGESSSGDTGSPPAADTAPDTVVRSDAANRTAEPEPAAPPSPSSSGCECRSPRSDSVPLTGTAAVVGLLLVGRRMYGR